MAAQLAATSISDNGADCSQAVNNHSILTDSMLQAPKSGWGISTTYSSPGATQILSAELPSTLAGLASTLKDLQAPENGSLAILSDGSCSGCV